MSLFVNTCEGGVDAATVTAGTSGGSSGDAFTIVSVGTSNTITYATSSAMHGGMGMHFTKGGTFPASIVGITDSGGGSASIAAHMYFRMTGYPSANGVALGIQPRSTADSQLGSLRITTTGLIQLVNPAGTTVATGAAVLSLNVWYRLEFFATGVGTASTTYTGKAYTGDGTSNVDFVSASSITTAAQCDRIRFGSHGTGDIAAYDIDDTAVNIGSATEIGPGPINVNCQPTTVSPAGVIPTVTVKLGTSTQPASIARVAAVGGAITDGQQIITPASVARFATIPGFNAQISSMTDPPAIASTAAVGVAAPATGITVFPDATAATAIVGAAAASGNATSTPATVARTASVPASAVSGSAGVTAVVVARAVALPAPALQTSETVTATTVGRVASVPTPAVGGGTTVTATHVQVVAAVGTPTFQTDSTVTPTVTARPATVPAPAVSGSAVVAPDAVTATAATPDVDITAQIFTTVTVVVVARTASVPAPQIIAVTAVSPVAVARTASVPGPAMQVGVKVAVGEVACLATVPLPPYLGSTRIRGTINWVRRQPVSVIRTGDS